MKKVAKKFINRTHDLIFKRIHNRNLIYNACWEDPRIDRQLMGITSGNKMVMITSAGCNALDYLLDFPEIINSVDVNRKQNALLCLKIALYRTGCYEDLFQMFGVGRHHDIKKTYKKLRPELPDFARDFWDKKIYYFGRPKVRKSFYYHGAAGKAAWLVKNIFNAKKQVRHGLRDLIEAKSLVEQKEIYMNIEDKLWNIVSKNMIKHPLMLAMLGVPRPQIQLIKDEYPGKIAGYVKDKLRHVLTEINISDNYFWRVYLTGSYTEECCPNYLKKENFELIRENIGRINIFNGTITQFLKNNPDNYSHYVLLDHQDWLAAFHPEALWEEWEQIMKNSSRGTKILMRSACSNIYFIPEKIKNSLVFHQERTRELDETDRVGTYGCSCFAEVI